jgi:hypothetical protein
MNINDQVEKPTSEKAEGYFIKADVTREEEQSVGER